MSVLVGAATASFVGVGVGIRVENWNLIGVYACFYIVRYIIKFDNVTVLFCLV